MKKLISSIMIVITLVNIFTIFAGTTTYAATWTDLGSGYRARWDGPNSGDGVGRYHVHVYNRLKQVGSEKCGGGASHGDQMNNVPKKIKDQVRKNPKYKEGGEKNKKLDSAAKKIKSQGLSKPAKIIIAIGLVIGATGTLFFPADDFAAWGNLIRVIVAG